MPTNLRQILTTAFILCCSIASFAQSPRQRDSLPASMRLGIKSTSFCLRTGLGIQGSFYYELGLAYNTFVASGHSGGGYNFYGAFTSFSAFRRREHTVSGLRMGAEFFGMGGFLGLEVSPLWGGGKQDVLITPKYGIGVPTASLYYAYHFSTNRWAVGRVGRHQVGLQVSPYLWRHDKLRNQKQWFWMRRKRR